MKKTSESRILVAGYSYFEYFMGESLAEGFKEVLVFSPIQSAFPTPEKRLLGEGIPGIVRAQNYEDALEKADLVALFDLGDVSKAKQAKRMGKGVYCVGEGEALETDRSLFKKTLVDRGLEKDATKWKFVKGIDALVHELKNKKAKKVWVKWDPTARGLGETFCVEDYKLKKTRIDELAKDLGLVLRDTWEFLVEENYEGAEPGSDIWLSNGEFLEYGLLGWELKDEAYLGKFISMDEFPGPVKKVHDAMAPVWKKYKVNGAISTESRVGKDRIPHYTDATMRMGCPPGQLISGGYKNLPAIINAIAHGEKVKPEFRGKYGAQLVIDCRGSDEEAVPIEYDWKKIKIHRPCRVGNQYYSIPDKDSGSCIGSAIGWGDSIEEATFDCLDAAESFKCPGATWNKLAFEELEEKIEEGEKYGLGKF